MTIGSVALVTALWLAGCSDDVVVDPDELVDQEETAQTESPTDEPGDTETTEGPIEELEETGQTPTSE